MPLELPGEAGARGLLGDRTAAGLGALPRGPARGETPPGPFVAAAVDEGGSTARGDTLPETLWALALLADTKRDARFSFVLRPLESEFSRDDTNRRRPMLELPSSISAAPPNDAADVLRTVVLVRDIVLRARRSRTGRVLSGDDSDKDGAPDCPVVLLMKKTHGSILDPSMLPNAWLVSSVLITMTSTPSSSVLTLTVAPFKDNDPSSGAPRFS